MNERNALFHAARTLAFARHVPLDKLVRRAELDMRRRLRDRFGAWRREKPAPQLIRSPNPLPPLFAARPGGYQNKKGTHRFTFLNRTREMDGDIDWQSGEPGAQGQLWRMNLHYMEYLEAVSDGLFAELVSGWIDGNPENKPLAWRDSWNSYALSLRVVVWMQQIARRAHSLSAKFLARAGESLVQQILFLERNLETDLGGNHLIKNIKALLWASTYFIGPEAERWRLTGLRLLKRELAEQILPDGVHYERSSSYHVQVLADLIECRQAIDGDKLSVALDEALTRMAQAACDLTHPDGGVAQFNDSGLSMAYSVGECLDVYAGLCGRRPSPRHVFSFPDAGYFGFRSDENYFVADCGPISPDELPAHGHGDVLSFENSIAGLRIFVDQGVFEYVAGEKRQSARSAMNHNTLCLAGAGQADFFSSFRCGRRPSVAVRRFAAGANGFVLEGSHDGFSHLPGKPVHVRRFSVSEREIVIDDRIEGTIDCAAFVSFLLHPDCKATAAEGTRVLIERGDAAVEMTSTAPILTEPAVWWPDMGVEQATARLRVKLSPACTFLSTTLKIVTPPTHAEQLGNP